MLERATERGRACNVLGRESKSVEQPGGPGSVIQGVQPSPALCDARLQSAGAPHRLGKAPIERRELAVEFIEFAPCGLEALRGEGAKQRVLLLGLKLRLLGPERVAALREFLAGLRQAVGQPSRAVGGLAEPLRERRKLAAQGCTFQKARVSRGARDAPHLVDARLTRQELRQLVQTVERVARTQRRLVRSKLEHEGEGRDLGRFEMPHECGETPLGNTSFGKIELQLERKNRR